MSHLHKHSDPLQQNDIQLRYLQFLLIIAEMFLHLDWSSTCGKLHWLDTIWKGTRVYIRSHH